jgi:16S rRNA C967 or C1407 C5-methylase (RsmB/RsmF family)
MDAALTTPDGFLRTLPHRHGIDGFFAARLRRAPYSR